jgi:hypothetical protein
MLADAATGQHAASVEAAQHHKNSSAVVCTTAFGRLHPFSRLAASFAMILALTGLVMRAGRSTRKALMTICVDNSKHSITLYPRSCVQALQVTCVQLQTPCH